MKCERPFISRRWEIRLRHWMIKNAFPCFCSPECDFSCLCLFHAPESLRPAGSGERGDTGFLVVHRCKPALWSQSPLTLTSKLLSCFASRTSPALWEEPLRGDGGDWFSLCPGSSLSCILDYG